MMKKSDLACLTALAALWGASYLFMRMCAGEFGAMTLAGARAAIAAALLLPLLAGDWRALRRHWKPVLLVGLTIIFLIAVATIPGFASYAHGSIPVALLAALLITLIPTTIAALLSAIGIAGMDRLVRFNVLA